MTNQQENPFVAVLFAMYGAFLQAVQGFEGCEIQAEKILKWNAMKLFSQIIDLAAPMQCDFQVLTHGDLWINNDLNIKMRKITC